MSPAGIHNSRERAGSSTPLSQPMMFPRSRSRGYTQDRGQERSRKIYRRYRPRMHVAHERPTSWPNFEVITKRWSCRPVARPYCRSSLFLFALLASSRALLVRPSAVSAGRLSPVLVVLPSLSPVKRKNQCDVTCALTTESFGVPTELSLSNPLYFEGKSNSSSRHWSLANCTIYFWRNRRRRKSRSISRTFLFKRETRTKLSYCLYSDRRMFPIDVSSL